MFKDSFCNTQYLPSNLITACFEKRGGYAGFAMSCHSVIVSDENFYDTFLRNNRNLVH